MKKTSLLRNRRGMTLLEIVMSTALLSIVGMAITATLVGSIRGWSSGTSKEFTTSSATVAMQKLSMDIRDGRSATVSNGTLTVTFPRVLTDGVTGEDVYDLSTSSAITRSYYISGGNLVRNIGGVVNVLGRGVTSATFGSTGGTVSVTLVSEEQVGTSTATQQVVGRIGLRNFRD
ncbi:MAG: prepilin-type N-terminal cleavage/methylation domain-containing protein [Armatimonadota bacterium]